MGRPKPCVPDQPPGISAYGVSLLKVYIPRFFMKVTDFRDSFLKVKDPGHVKLLVARKQPYYYTNTDSLAF